MQHTRIQQNGLMFVKIFLVLLITVSMLSGCSDYWFVGDGRGDWIIDIYAGYAIDKVNSDSIYLVHRKKNENVGVTVNEIVIEKYFVTGYQVHPPYIFVEGIHTQSIGGISDDEWERRELNYYLIDTATDEISGPFLSEDDLSAFCNSLEMLFVSQWIVPKKAEK